jgi:hypothetical protein
MHLLDCIMERDESNLSNYYHMLHPPSFLECILVLFDSAKSKHQGLNRNVREYNL